ncbi:MAG: aminotransferase class III-fold pyridoxal phosphate-dependent enzyme [Rhodospirillales bacterium]|nr:aminotransferase class III-fold pyridoxal phosphate-dependent enzyme [Rhodospirillales bacterium]
MKTVAIIQARAGSSRLPGKIFKDLAGLSILGWAVRAAQAIPGVDQVIVATSVEAGDDAVEVACQKMGVACFRGDEDDVLSRMTDAATHAKAAVVFRLTADCPLLDPAVCGALLQLFKQTGADYATNTSPASWPDGLDCEVMTLEALRLANEKARKPSDREHVTPYIRNNQHKFQCEVLRCPVPHIHDERWTVDDEGDYAFLQAVSEALPQGRPPSYCEVLEVLATNPAFYDLRAESARNEGYTKSVLAAPYYHEGYETSNQLIKRALQTIPLGSQTFSKSQMQFPESNAPLFLTHGAGSTVWDVDGNSYVDYVSGLLPNTLGYCDPDVDEALARQLSRGISFSMATELEMQLAEKLRDIIPSAEMTRFGKNGTDATSAAIRLARAFTGREHVIVSGYHGWQDWYIGSTTRHLGVPEGVRQLTHVSPYNDLAKLEENFAQYEGQVAAVIMEPVGAMQPNPGYLQAVKEMAHRNGALLVFDEIITGFRIHLGGAQTHYGVTPDLSCFGKGMGNGMPISAIVGRADIMTLMEKIFYSGTFGGEALSLAASIAVIDKMERENVIGRLWQTGQTLADETNALISSYGLLATIKLNGLAPWKVLQFNDHETASKEAIRTRFLTDMLRNGILLSASHNICYAHSQVDIEKTKRAYDVTLSRIAEELEAGTLEQNLDIPPIRPVFQVRS